MAQALRQKISLQHFQVTDRLKLPPKDQQHFHQLKHFLASRQAKRNVKIRNIICIRPNPVKIVMSGLLILTNLLCVVKEKIRSTTINQYQTFVHFNATSTAPQPLNVLIRMVMVVLIVRN